MNIENKKEFRKKVEELLAKVPEGKRVQLKPEILNELLFDELVLIPEDNEKVKLPTWSGDFLSKIDLSEVSFDNVSWSSLMKMPYVYREDSKIFKWDDEKNIEKLYLEFRKNVSHVLGNGYSVDELWGDADEYLYEPAEAIVNYSNINAKIDFLKSWEAKKTGKIIIFNCNFSGTNLEHLDFDKVGEIKLCNFSNTGIKFDASTFLKLFWARKIQNNDFSNNNFSNIILEFDCIPGPDDSVYFDIDVSNTGITIDFDYPNIAKINDYDQDKIDEDKEILIYLLKMGIWNGCYYKDVFIQTSEENAEELMNFMLTGKSKQDLVNEQKQLESEEELNKEFIQSTIEDLEEQINGFSK